MLAPRLLTTEEQAALSPDTRYTIECRLSGSILDCAAMVWYADTYENACERERWLLEWISRGDKNIAGVSVYLPGAY